MRIRNILVTGGCGFMGSHFVRFLLQKEKDCKIINIDCLSYAGDTRRVQDINNDKRYYFIKGDIRKKEDIKEAFSYGIDVVVHFAAESHVDNSINNPNIFEEVNVKGTLNLLNFSMNSKIKKFIYVSTDEVYGDIKKGKFKEDSALKPSSPYSASKAAGDLFVKAYMRTYSFPGIIVRCSNNYGPWQYPEKFIPVVICNALLNRPIPVYATGENVREWLHVTDCVQAIFLVMKKSRAREIFNIGSDIEKKNIEIAHLILDILGKPKTLLKFVPDRPGHDWRYRLDSNKIRTSLSWKPTHFLIKGIEEKIGWFSTHKKWWINNFKTA